MTEFVPWITQQLDQFGYFGIFLLMTLESANIPIPSEVTLPFAGFLVSKGILNFHLAAFMGAFGCLVGSVFSYWLGYHFGRPFVARWGKWIFLRPSDIERGDRWMQNYGNSVSFFSRLLPVVRTFISFVAGIWKAPFWLFALLSFLGSWIWSYALVYLGIQLGEHWEELHALGRRLDILIVIAILIVVGVWVWKHKYKKTVSL